MTDSNTKRLIITGAAGFIGAHAMRHALQNGYDVLAIDNLNDYYAPSLKAYRLDQVRKTGPFEFRQLDIADNRRLKQLFEEFDPTHVLHLAAQAGVRHSIDHPFEYIDSNIQGHLSVLEAIRACSNVRHLVYASSSSVYGNACTPPFSETHRVDRPASLYAATKRSGELIASSYADLYGIRATGLRFFTVYGPWGRPDMAYWIFANAILDGQPIKLFNKGDMKRDFTYIDDVITYMYRVLEADECKHDIYNIGGAESYDLKYFVDVVADCCGQEYAATELPMQKGDVYRTQADVSRLVSEFGTIEKTGLEAGMPLFVDWLKDYRSQPG